MNELENKIDRCFDMLQRCNQHLQTYIRRSVVVNNNYLREYAKRAVLRKARHIVKLAELIRYYQLAELIRHYQLGGNQ